MSDEDQDDSRAEYRAGEAREEQPSHHRGERNEMHTGTQDDCAECRPDAVAHPEQLCFAIATKTGTLVTRVGRPLWATRKFWEKFPALHTQLIPIQGVPPIGSMALEGGGAPDVVGQLIEQLDRLDRQTVEGAKAIQLLGTIAVKGAESLGDLSLMISQRIHFVELLDRAAAMIDPDRPEGTANYEARLDWLAKWREVVGR